MKTRAAFCSYRKEFNMSVTKFDCNKIKRRFWPFVLKDKVDENGRVTEKGKQIAVRMPQKRVFERIQAIADINETNADVSDTNAIYDLVAAVLENNIGNVPINIADVEEFDIDECTQILQAYMEFVDELKNDPN